MDWLDWLMLNRRRHRDNPNGHLGHWGEGLKKLCLLMSILATGCFTYNSGKKADSPEWLDDTADIVDCLESWEEMEEPTMEELICVPLDRSTINPFKPLEETNE